MWAVYPAKPHLQTAKKEGRVSPALSPKRDDD